jgi:hypothetical protein
MPDDHNLVSIHIDNKEKKSPNPTTGAALYVVGEVDPNTYDLFREVHKGDDEHILSNTTPVQLKDGDHFFSVQKKLNPGIR